MKSEAPRPWYREPWPWLLMSGPAIVIVAGLFTAALAVMSDDGLVADDYYRQGLAINKALARDAQARELHVSAEVRFSGSQVEVIMHGREPAMLRLRLVHPTRAGHDESTLLEHRDGAIYGARIASVQGGARRLILDDASGTWRLTGEWPGRDGEIRLVPAS